MEEEFQYSLFLLLISLLCVSMCAITWAYTHGSQYLPNASAQTLVILGFSYVIYLVIFYLQAQQHQQQHQQHQQHHHPSTTTTTRPPATAAAHPARPAADCMRSPSQNRFTIGERGLVIGKWKHNVVKNPSTIDEQRDGYQRLHDDDEEAAAGAASGSAMRTPRRLLSALLRRPASSAAAEKLAARRTPGMSPHGGAGGGAPLLHFSLERQHGVFGMKLDAFNRVMVVGKGLAAERCGLRVGDVVVTCDGQPLAGELSQAMHGKERAELGVRRTGPS